MGKHIHHDLIVAWANDAEIQYLHNGTWNDIKNPMWNIDTIYRIKTKDIILTWKDIFDSSKAYYGNIYKASDMAAKCGYKYFMFNDILYEIRDKNGFFYKIIEIEYYQIV